LAVLEFLTYKLTIRQDDPYRFRKMSSAMTELLKTAMAEVELLPDAAQDEIGRELLTYLEKLHWLRAEIDKGIRNLDAGEGRELDIDEFLKEMHRRHASR
jgi:hypothetical protein